MQKKEAFFKKCLVCGKNDFSIFSKNEYRIWYTCCSCGLLRKKHIKKEVNLRENYYGGKFNLGNIYNKIYFYFYIRFVLLSYINNSEFLLDLGCGDGRFLGVLGRFFPKKMIYGVEPDPEGALIVGQKGFVVFDKVLSKCGFKSDFFKVITAFHVVEHFTDPIEEIREIGRVLKPGGYFVAFTPNIRSWGFKIGGKDWWGFDSPYHTVLWSPELLGKFLEDNGFEIVSRRNLVFEQISCIYNTLKVKLCVKNRFVFSFIKILLVPFSLILTLIENMFNYSESFEIIVRKK